MIEQVLLGLDLASAFIVTLVAMRFIRIWRLSRDDLHLLLAGGFLLLAIGMSVTSHNAFDLDRTADRFDAISLVAGTGASLVLLAAYLSARWHGAPRPSFVLGSAMATLASGLVVLFAFIPPLFVIPPILKAALYAHIVQMCAFLAVGIVSGQEFFKNPNVERSLVPLGFLALALSQYTWVLYDITEAAALVPIVYVWRFVMVASVVGAVLWRPKPMPAFDPNLSLQ